MSEESEGTAGELAREFERSSPTLQREVEAFCAEAAAWQREAEVPAFVQIIETHGEERVRVRLVPAGLKRNQRIPPVPAALRSPHRADGFRPPQQSKVVLTVEPTPDASSSVKGSEALRQELQQLIRGLRKS